MSARNRKLQTIRKEKNVVIGKQEVGLIRSKGVVGVMPSAGKTAHLKGSAIM